MIFLEALLTSENNNVPAKKKRPIQEVYEEEEFEEEDEEEEVQDANVSRDNNVDVFSLGKSLMFTDLDYNIWKCRIKSNVAVASQHIGLFRVMSKDRIKEVLNDLTFQVDYFRSKLVVFDHSVMSISPFNVFSLAFQLMAFPVYSNDQLLRDFMIGRFSCLNWNGLSLKHFIDVNLPENNYTWIDVSSVHGRNGLIKAIEGIQLCCYIFFNDNFKDAFIPLINIFQRPFSRLLSCHDIYIKFKIEILFAGYFDDIFNKESSNLFSDINLSSSNGRIELLNLYIKKFEESITSWEVIPHTAWYECPGGANQIILDPFTFERVRVKHPFYQKYMTSQVQPISSYSSQMNVGFQNYNSSSYEKSNTNNVNFVSNPVQHYSDNLSVKGNNKWTNRNVNFGSDNSLSNRKKYPICIWNVADQLGFILKDGRKAVCTKKGCPQDSHKLLKNISMNEVINLISKMHLSAETRSSLKNVVQSSAHKFAK